MAEGIAGERELEVVVWGATGFTGRLVAEYLLERHGVGGELRWALGGRSRKKLESVREEIGRATATPAGDLPILLGDADDEASLGALARRTRVVCTTVGPYATVGSKLVAACARAGTHYCDLTGEVQWMRRMIDAHQARHGVPCALIKYRVAGFRGGFSGGTAASLLNVLDEAARDPAVRRIVADPYALDPEGRSGPDGPDPTTPVFDADFDAWTGPFVMSGINTRVVRRSHALLGRPWGPDFRYDEAMLMGAGAVGWLKAAALCAALGGVLAAGSIGALRRALGRLLPAPGEGPSRAQREAGFFDIRLFGEHPVDRGKSLRGRVTGDRDPGYGSTAKMLGESALCLAKDPLTVGGGFWTPASALGEPLLARLRDHAGLTFSIEAG
jgi:short subunit dehydrogenase-like uncharacterized protein